MKVIAECGASKSDWRLISQSEEICQVSTLGINVSTMSPSAIGKVVEQAAEGFGNAALDVVGMHVYLAGVITEDIRQELTVLFGGYFPNSSFEFQTDLIAAARAVCGHGPGIAAILGTGSNSCQWSGTEIVKRVYSSGFILGDEGSAATLGKLFIADFLKGLVPAEIANEFSARFPSDYATIVSNVYRSQTSPSGYLGSFAPFILEHYEHPYIKELVDGNFRAFIRRSLKQYDTQMYPVGVVGGFGCALKDIFGCIAMEEGVRISGFFPRPIEGLIAYHSKE